MYLPLGESVGGDGVGNGTSDECGDEDEGGLELHVDGKTR